MRYYVKAWEIVKFFVRIAVKVPFFLKLKKTIKLSMKKSLNFCLFYRYSKKTVSDRFELLFRKHL